MKTKTTKTGQGFEATIGDALMRAGIDFRHGERLGKLPWGADHIVDYALYKIGVLVSLKYQGVSGTADEKIPFEVIKLESALHTNPQYRKAYIVIAGDGMRKNLRAWYLKTGKDGLKDYLSTPHVSVISLDEFLGKVSRRELA